MKLKGKFALVTGGSTGIGRAIAIALAKEGVCVLLSARNKQGLEDTLAEIQQTGGEGDIFPADLANPNSVFGLAQAVSGFVVDQLDIVVNVAGIWHGNNEAYSGKKLEDFSKAVITDTLNVGTLAPMLLLNALISQIPENGKVINITGTFEDGGKGWLPYYVSKRALEDFTVGLAQELSVRKIQVNAISPSDVATDAYKKYFPQYAKDALAPEKIAEFVVNLATDDLTTGKIFVMQKGKEPFDNFHG